MLKRIINNPCLRPYKSSLPPRSPCRHAPLLVQGSSDSMHVVNGPQQRVLPYMDITTKALLAVGDQVVAVV